jgi:hypothetical protein
VEKITTATPTHAPSSLLLGRNYLLESTRKLIDRVARYRIRESEAIVAEQVVSQLRHSWVFLRWLMKDGGDRTKDRQNLSSFEDPVDEQAFLVSFRMLPLVFKKLVTGEGSNA